ncbi:hypothetical protein OG785_14415 [Streptomyces sp. NBC_00006]|uniref:hypothetical protein n=1 Tax=Streptomyces sp. NBC_00006 TaxID=2975619 RepID=UPI002254A5AA|nr:hypothetical protein [Streptomyces sp. NBC_00006]MCX5531757.1 hypothetical protein [Streptomyces sp. NBC_00006]
MSGRHWNEETQRWEEAGSGPGSVSSPPPPRPEFAPPSPWPGPEAQEPPPPSSPPGRTRRFAVVVLGAAVLGAAVATTVVLLGRGDDPGPDPKPTGTSAAPTSSGPEPTPTPTPTASPTDELPAGYREVSDDAGFTLAVPEGWDRSESKQGVFYTSPDESSLIQIFTITEPDTTPLESLRVAADSLSTSLSKDGYEQSSLEETSAPEGASDVVTDDAAELVYSYDSEKLGARRKVVDFSFTAQDGTQYAVLVAGPESEWPGQRDRLATALSRFAQG